MRKALCGVAVEAARAQVVNGRLMTPQRLLEEIRGLRERVIERARAATAPATLASRGTSRPTRAASSSTAVDEIQPVVFHQESERRAVGAAAEAVIEALVRADGEGGRLLAVKRAAGLVLAARLLELDARADDLDDVRSLHQLVDEVLWNARSHDW